MRFGKIRAACFIGVFILSFLSCIPAGRSPKKYKTDFSKVYNKDAGNTHSALVSALKEKGFVIISDTGAPGRIETGWLDIDTVYYYGTFKRESPVKYCDCGRPDINWTYERIRTKLITIIEKKPEGTGIVIVPNFATYAKYSPCISFAIRDPDEELKTIKKCESTGEFEKELFAIIEKNLLQGGSIE